MKMQTQRYVEGFILWTILVIVASAVAWVYWTT